MRETRSSDQQRALSQAYSDLFMLIERLSRGSLNHLPPLKVRNSAVTMLQRNRRALLAAGLPETMVNDLQVVIVATIDEVARRDTSDDFADAWPSVMLALYERETIGQDVFPIISEFESSRKTPVEILSLIEYCLTLGLWGHVGEENPEQLKVLHTSLKNTIEARRPSSPPLSPDLIPLAKRARLPPTLTTLQQALVAMVAVILLSVAISAHLMQSTADLERALEAVEVEPVR